MLDIETDDVVVLVTQGDNCAIPLGVLIVTITLKQVPLACAVNHDWDRNFGVLTKSAAVFFL